MFFKVTLKERHALGNGTRNAGDVLALVGPADSLADVVECAQSHVGNKLGDFPIPVHLAAGVAGVELLTALRNDSRCEITQTKKKPVDPPSNETDDESTDVAPSDVKLSDVEGLNKGDANVLNGAGLLTVGDVLGHDDDEGLESISGIGAARRERILEALATKIDALGFEPGDE